MLQIPGSSTPTDDDAEATSTGHTSCNRIQPREEQDPPPETHSYDSTHRPRSQSSRSKPFRPLPRSISPVNVFVTPSCHCSRSRLHTPLHIPCGCSKRTPSMRSPFGSSRFTPSPGPSGTTPFSPASGRRQAPTRASPSPPLRSQWDQGIKQGSQSKASIKQDAKTAPAISLSTPSSLLEPREKVSISTSYGGTRRRKDGRGESESPGTMVKQSSIQACIGFGGSKRR